MPCCKFETVAVLIKGANRVLIKFAHCQWVVLVLLRVTTILESTNIAKGLRHEQNRVEMTTRWRRTNKAIVLRCPRNIFIIMIQFKLDGGFISSPASDNNLCSSTSGATLALAPGLLESCARWQWILLLLCCDPFMQRSLLPGLPSVQWIEKGPGYRIPSCWFLCRDREKERETITEDQQLTKRLRVILGYFFFPSCPWKFPRPRERWRTVRSIVVLSPSIKHHPCITVYHTQNHRLMVHLTEELLPDSKTCKRRLLRKDSGRRQERNRIQQQYTPSSTLSLSVS